MYTANIIQAVTTQSGRVAGVELVKACYSRVTPAYSGARHIGATFATDISKIETSRAIARYRGHIRQGKRSTAIYADWSPR